MFWRITETLPPLSEPLDFSVGAIFTLVELLAMIGTSLALIFLTRTKDRTPEANANVPWLKSLPEQPLVDVLVCTYNEEEAILERTIIGALGIDYPRYRLWVCDDGRRAWLKDLCERHGCGYITRPDNTHAKAGNINHALLHLAELREQPEFVAILDADFVAKAQFLTRTVALMREADVGVVQTPQHFFNPDPIQTNLALVKRVAGRAALLLRRGDGFEGRMGRRILLRHLIGHCAMRRLRVSAASRRIPSPRTTWPRLRLQRDRLPHRLSQRAAVARARA